MDMIRSENFYWFKYLKNWKIFLWKKRRFRLRWDSSPGLSIAGSFSNSFLAILIFWFWLVSQRIFLLIYWFNSYPEKNGELIQLFRFIFVFVKYTTDTLLAGTTIFFVDLTTCIFITRTRVVKSTRKVIVPTNKIVTV